MKQFVKRLLAKMEAKMDVTLETTKSCIKEAEVNRGKVIIKMEACIEEMKVETMGTLEDRYGDHRLALRRRGRPKKRSQGDGGSQKKLAVVRDRLTDRDIPALRKELIHKGPGKDNRQRHQRKRPNFVM
jgi:hypothetical protein